MGFKSSRRSRRNRNTPQPEQGKATPFFQAKEDATSTPEPFFQPKLKIGEPGDRYEQEADAVANAVVNGKQQNAIAGEGQAIQRMPDSEMEKDKMIQEKPEEELQKMEEEEPVQMMGGMEEEEPVQMMGGMEEEEPVQMMGGMEEEEPVQMMGGMEEEEPVQMMGGQEEEEPVQAKAQSDSSPTASDKLASQLNQQAGRGRGIDKNTQAKMESGIGYDFSQVNIHTGEQAVQMNQELGARAFTRGNDVYFNRGQYQPETTAGQHLLAHELTHVVQQGASKKDSGEYIQSKKEAKPSYNDCTSSQKKSIHDHYATAQTYVNNAITKLSAAESKHPKIDASTEKALNKHFHTTDKKHIKKIRSRFTDIKTAIDKGIRFECETGCDNLGYVWQFLFWHVGRIHICIDEFNKSSTGVKISTIIHEVSHRHAGLDDKAYNWEGKYKKLSPKKAMNNADSYSCFANEVNGVSDC